MAIECVRGRRQTISTKVNGEGTHAARCCSKRGGENAVRERNSSSRVRQRKPEAPLYRKSTAHVLPFQSRRWIQILTEYRSEKSRKQMVSAAGAASMRARRNSALTSGAPNVRGI